MDPSRSEKSTGNKAAPATVLESVDEIRAILGRTAPDERKETQPSHPTGLEALAEGTSPFRPSQRPGMALLCVFDDGAETGEEIRIRAATFRIGRVEGDLVIPHDAGISGRHAEISRRYQGGQYRWFLKDLDSTNGTFVRVARAILPAEQEFLVGGTRLRLEFPAMAQPMGDPSQASERIQATQKWQTPSRDQVRERSTPSLVEVRAEGNGQRWRLNNPEIWLGSDARACAIVLEDPQVSHRHARLSCDGRDRWYIQNARSLNGVWLRIQEIALERGGQFQCGEQRFAIKVM